MSGKPFSYDPDCEFLARRFLEGERLPPLREAEMTEDARVRSLAQAIQDAVEAWFDERREN